IHQTRPRETFVQVTKNLREEFADNYKHMVVITIDEYDVIGFLPNSPKLFLINWEADYQEKVHVANSFEEFVEILIRREMDGYHYPLPWWRR
ncbi:hypothetical protein JQC72_12135, partial [Polycladomyces sp. WAk]